MFGIIVVSKPFGHLTQTQAFLERKATVPEAGPNERLYLDKEFMDDVHGGVLGKNSAIRARKTEIAYFRRIGVYANIDCEKLMKVISTTWIATNKGDIADPNYRARQNVTAYSRQRHNLGVFGT